jgi:haloalkane dehalogenase
VKEQRRALIFSPLCLLAASAAPAFALATESSDSSSSASSDVRTSDAGAVEALSGVVATDRELGEILRAPIDRFSNLSGYSFKANYIDVGRTGPLQMHYLDEGSRDGKIILLMHGNPSWVYNFREMIPGLVAAGYRVIAPDLIGFGKSDKPATRSAYTYDRQVEWLTRFIFKLRLRDIHLHCQDWGGLIGLRLAAKYAPLFRMVVASNTDLPEGDNPSPAFLQWRDASQVVRSYGDVMEQGTFSALTAAEKAAYDAPFPEERYKAAPREMPRLVPISPSDREGLENAALWRAFAYWQKPFLTIFSEGDTITAGAQQKMIERIPGAAGQNHLAIPNTGHFIREDIPQEMVGYLTAFFR